MDITINFIVFVHNCIAGLLMPWLGLLLINIRPPMRKLLIIAILYGLLGLILRSFLAIPYDISFYSQVFFLLLITMIIPNVNFPKSFIANLFGIITLTLGEIVSTIFIIHIFDPSIEMTTNPVILSLLPLPQIAITLLLIYLCVHFDFHFFNLSSEETLTIRHKRTKIIISLIFILLFMIAVQILFSLFIINREFDMFHGISIPIISIVSVILSLLGVVAMVFLIMQLIKLIQKESDYYNQKQYVQTFDELYTAIRCERHDILNHLQTIYGYSQLGYLEELIEYLQELLGEGVFSQDFVVASTPGLTALFYIKSGVAKINSITMKVNILNEIGDDLAIPTYELNNVLGNLINNAFDAVSQLDYESKIVNVTISSNDREYKFSVANSGYIDDELKKNILKKGFSTKSSTDGHSGLGLYTCNKIIEKYNGTLTINNLPDNMVEFLIVMPKVNQKQKIN